MHARSALYNCPSQIADAQDPVWPLGQRNTKKVKNKHGVHNGLSIVSAERNEKLLIIRFMQDGCIVVRESVFFQLCLGKLVGSDFATSLKLGPLFRIFFVLLNNKIKTDTSKNHFTQ